MSCEYESKYEQIFGWANGDTPVVFKSCLCFGQKNAPNCPYFLDDNQKDCPKYKEKISK